MKKFDIVKSICYNYIIQNKNVRVEELFECYGCTCNDIERVIFELEKEKKITDFFGYLNKGEK